MKVLNAAVAAVILLVPFAVSSKPAARASGLDAAVESAALAMGTEYDRAVEYLQTRQDVFSAGAPAITRVVGKYRTDADVARRLLDLAAASGSQGCSFSASLVARQYPAWVSGVLKRYPEGLRCDAMDKAVAGILKWAPDPSASRESELLVIETMGALSRAFNIQGAESACRYLESDSIHIRTAAAGLISSVRPDRGLVCLVKAYDREKNREEKGMADILLEAIAAYGGANAYPHLLNAMETPGQFEIACRLMAESGDDALLTMIRAARVYSGRSSKLMNCLSIHGAQAQVHILPLLKDKSRDIRNFALDFFSRNQSLAALTVLKAGFLNNNVSNELGFPREQIFDAIAGYPVEDIRDMVQAALTDNDDRIRDRGLELVRNRKSLAFSSLVRAVAETDPNRASRLAALKTLWYLGDNESETLLRRMAQYEEAVISAESARVLGYIGNADSIDTLRKIASGSSGAPKSVEAMKSLAFLGLTADPLSASYVRMPERKPFKVDGYVSCGAFRAGWIGRSGPLVMALPGGPGMDSAWARPWMDDLSSDATVAYLEPVGATGDEPVVLTPQDFDCFAEAFGREKVVLVSDGLGGTAAHWLAYQIPGRISGIATLSAPPAGGSLDMMDGVAVRSLPQPFSDMASQLIDKADYFRPEALDVYMTRVMAPVMAGSVKEARRALGVMWNTRRLQTARRELSKPEVRFVPLEVNRPVLWILPAGMMGRETMESFQSVAAQNPGMIRIFGTDADCGMMPQISCGRQVLKQIRGFVESL